MNYRHVYHAGGIADVFKHVVLLHCLHRLRQKEMPFFVLDTHAGTGIYNFTAIEANKTKEYEGGAGKFWNSSPSSPLLRKYKALLQTLNPGKALQAYPGSPAIIQEQLRAGDRAQLCELHADDYSLLKQRFAADARIGVHCRDAYEALAGLLPPEQKRGLVLIDPPYEETTELEDLASALLKNFTRFATGIWMIWYPIKDRAPLWHLHSRLEALKKPILTLEFLTQKQEDRRVLNGSGLLIINPPYRFGDELEVPLNELCTLLTGQDGKILSTIHQTKT